MITELTTNKTRELEKSLEKQRVFSEKQILSAENTIKKWLNFIVSETGWGKIEIFINAEQHTIDVKPTPNIRHSKE